MWTSSARLSGRLAYHLRRGRRRLAEERLGRARPDLDRAERRRLLRSSFEHGAAAGAATRAAIRIGPRELCRRLTLEDWENLAAAGDRGRGVLIMPLGTGLWRLATLAPALYLGPLEVFGEGGRDPLLERLAGHLERRLGQPILTPLDSGNVSARLAAGARVGFLAEDLEARATAAKAALETGAAVVPVAARAGPRGGYRLAARPPIVASGTPDADHMTRRLEEAAALERQRRPELAAWDGDSWRTGDFDS